MNNTSDSYFKSEIHFSIFPRSNTYWDIQSIITEFMPFLEKKRINILYRIPWCVQIDGQSTDFLPKKKEECPQTEHCLQSIIESLFNLKIIPNYSLEKDNKERLFDFKKTTDLYTADIFIDLSFSIQSERTSSKKIFSNSLKIKKLFKSLMYFFEHQSAYNPSFLITDTCEC